MKKMLCAALCAALLVMTACSSAPVEPSAAPDLAPTASTAPVGEPDQSESPAGTDAPGEQTFYTTDDAAYRDLYSTNPIEEAFNQDFIDAVSLEDFDALATRYVSAWKSEYHALMDALMAAHPDDAEELQGLIQYTDDQAQSVYDATYAANQYTDEDGALKPAAGAEQNANFDMAEVYKSATILSILNDYRGEEPYAFHYSAQ